MKPTSFYFLIKICTLFIATVFVMVIFASFTPKDFPIGVVITIPKNSTLTDVAERLAQYDVIRSPFLLKVVVRFGNGTINAGAYSFDQPQNLWTVAKRLVRGEQGLKKIKVTIPEGSTNKDIAWILLRQIPDFNAPVFVRLAEKFEGYLFPDTYFFYPNVTAQEVIDELTAQSTKRLEALKDELHLSKRKLHDVVIMASILEREAITTRDREVIAGILWKRLDEGMPLQVDATIVYITGGNFVTIQDTKIDSPYNTYKFTGLPPGPISNPGMDSLVASLRSVKTPYYYYLSDLKGTMYYATTFDGHQINREKYLNK